MTVRDSVASAYIKNVGQAFQNKIKKQIIDTFSQDFPNCLSNRDDITSCPSCNHGEDIKLSNRFRAIFPVSIECKKNENKEIEIDLRAQTSCKGIFAAGDVTNIPFKQLMIASGQGVIAALSAIDYLNYLNE